MIKKIILIVVILLTTGCWDKKEIKELAMINSFLFDYKDGKIIFLAEIVNPKTQSATSKQSSSSSPYIYIRGEGDKILEATDESSFSINKTLYTAHIKTIFMTEAFAREKGFSGLFDLLIRYPELRQSEYIVIIKGQDAEELYKSASSLSDFFGDFIDDSKKAHINRLSGSVYTTLLDIIKNYYNCGIQPIIGVIQKKETAESEENKANPVIDKDTKDNTKVVYKGAAIFREDRLIDFISEKDTITYNLIKGDLKAVDLSVESTMFKVIKTRTSIKTKMNNKKVSIDLNIKAELMVYLEEEKKNFAKTKTVMKLEKKISDKLTKEASDFIKMTQEKIKLDFIGFGKTFHIQNPKEWKKINKDWNKYFSNADFKVKVDCTITSNGKITSSFKLEE